LEIILHEQEYVSAGQTVKEHAKSSQAPTSVFLLTTLNMMILLYLVRE